VDDCFPTEERRKRGRGSEELATDKLRERCAVQRAHTHYTFAKPSAETYWDDPAWEEPAATFQQLAPQGFGEAFAIANGRDRCAMNAAALALHAAVGVQGPFRKEAKMSQPQPSSDVDLLQNQIMSHKA
jgi:hypothetical protein